MAMCPTPWHLKHILVLKGLGLRLFWGGILFCGVWVVCGVEGAGAIGLGKGMGLPLLKGWFWDRGLGNSCLKGVDFLYYSTLWAKTHTLSKAEYCCKSSTFVCL